MSSPQHRPHRTAQPRAHHRAEPELPPAGRGRRGPVHRCWRAQRPRKRRYNSRPLLDLDGILAVALATGHKLAAREGIMVKPLPNALMAPLPDAAVRSLVLAARPFPDHPVMHYLVLRRRPE
jgi:hypothetical protein